MAHATPSLDIEGTVRGIVGRLARSPDPASLPIDVDVFRHLGIASSTALELLLSLEDELGVQIADAAFNEARTIAALVDVVRRAAP